MSGESPLPSDQVWRLLTTAEKRLVSALLHRGPSLHLPENWVDNVLASPMKDGGMGSLRFKPTDISCDTRRMGSQHSEIYFKDVDGVDVSATLNLDEQQQPFELDVWRTDFGPLIAIPDSLD